MNKKTFKTGLDIKEYDAWLLDQKKRGERDYGLRKTSFTKIRYVRKLLED